MGRILFDTATTINGWIADSNNSLAWLFAVAGGDHPDDGLFPTFVFTTRELPTPEGADIRFVRGPISDHLGNIREAAGDGDIRIVGGGDLAGQFLDAGALDAIALSVAPVAFDGGAPLLPRRIESDRLRLVSVEAHGQFARLLYDVVTR